MNTTLQENELNQRDNASHHSTKKNILGRHMCSLQWISWKDFGSVTISQDSDKTIHVKGGQKSRLILIICRLMERSQSLTHFISSSSVRLLLVWIISIAVNL